MPPFGGIKFGQFLKKRVEVDVGHALVEQAVEPSDQADDLDAQLIRAGDRAADGRVERGSVTASRDDGHAIHVIFGRDRPASRSIE